MAIRADARHTNAASTIANAVGQVVLTPSLPHWRGRSAGSALRQLSHVATTVTRGAQSVTTAMASRPRTVLEREVSIVRRLQPSELSRQGHSSRAGQGSFGCGADTHLDP